MRWSSVGEGVAAARERAESLLEQFRPRQLTTTVQGVVAGRPVTYRRRRAERNRLEADERVTTAETARDQAEAAALA
ncbi:MAG: hypothetical protein ACRDRN_01555 [Sciscionella sp.]